MEELRTDSLDQSNSANSVSDENDSSHINDRSENPDGLRQRHSQQHRNGVGAYCTNEQSLGISALANGASKRGVPSIVQLDNVHHEAKRSFDEIQTKFNEDVKQLLENVATMAVNSSRANYDTSIPDNVSFSYASNRSRKGVTRKVFTARNSILTELLEISHIGTVYNIFVAILIIFSIQTVVYDLFEVGRIRIDFTLISWGFGKFPLVTSIWLTMMASTLSVFPLFSLWNYLRYNHKQRAGLCDATFIVLYAVYICGFLAAPAWAIIDNDLPPVSSLVVVCEQVVCFHCHIRAVETYYRHFDINLLSHFWEQVDVEVVRLIMKAHAFIRENVPKCISTEKKDGRHGLDFSKYLYFLFVPTLIYREAYPRTESVNWNFVVVNLMQIVVCIFYLYYIFMRFLVPNFHNFNHDHVTLKAFVISAFGCMMPGTLCLLIGFFALLHLWMNAWAEMLRFGDRLFYKDWWNSTSFASYYRNWNVVVHDWLYTYLYVDTSMVLGTKYRWIAMHLTFFLSAVVHEYIIVMAFKFFYPILFFQFGVFGVCIIYVLNGSWQRTSNIAMWVLLVAGTGILMALYSMEWYARINCQVTVNSWVDYLIPHSWFCESLASQNITLPSTTITNHLPNNVIEPVI